MPAELTALALAGLLPFAHFALASVMANRDLGGGHATGPRDHASSRTMRPVTARRLRAPDRPAPLPGLFATAGRAFTASGGSSPQPAACICRAARARPIPGHALGWHPRRCDLWGVALTCCATLILVALL